MKTISKKFDFISEVSLMSRFPVNEAVMLVHKQDSFFFFVFFCHGGISSLHVLYGETGPLNEISLLVRTKRNWVLSILCTFFPSVFSLYAAFGLVSCYFSLINWSADCLRFGEFKVKAAVTRHQHNLFFYKSLVH